MFDVETGADITDEFKISLKYNDIDDCPDSCKIKKDDICECEDLGVFDIGN